MKYTRFLTIGPGGRRCPCCFPGPNEKNVYYRSAKRKDKNMIKKEIKEELSKERRL